MSGAVSHPPLSVLLSQVLVAFTIEFDNDFEHQMPHRITNRSLAPGARSGPWLVSLVMWSNCMRFIGEQGVSVIKLEKLARTKTNLNGMERWGYIVVAPDPADRRPKPPRSAWLIHATARGRMAQDIWRRLFDVIEKRWEVRFGSESINRLRQTLLVPIGQMDVELPDCLPILRYGLFSKGPNQKRHSVDSHLPLAALLSRALLAIAIEFERESEFSLAICANVVRVLDEKGVRVRDLPLLTGVSKEAISMALGILQKSRAVVVEPDRTKVVRLTRKGLEAQAAYHQLVGAIEQRWQARFGNNTVRKLRESLERLAGAPLFGGLEPYPDGWRASIRKPSTLPHYPMVLHRGGFPDGS
jgi:DNA-binding MarR family transcriptional regulator